MSLATDMEQRSWRSFSLLLACTLPSVCSFDAQTSTCTDSFKILHFCVLLCLLPTIKVNNTTRCLLLLQRHQISILFPHSLPPSCPKTYSGRLIRGTWQQWHMSCLGTSITYQITIDKENFVIIEVRSSVNKYGSDLWNPVLGNKWPLFFFSYACPNNYKSFPVQDLMFFSFLKPINLVLNNRLGNYITRRIT